MREKGLNKRRSWLFPWKYTEHQKDIDGIWCDKTYETENFEADVCTEEYPVLGWYKVVIAIAVIVIITLFAYAFIFSLIEGG